MEEVWWQRIRWAHELPSPVSKTRMELMNSTALWVVSNVLSSQTMLMTTMEPWVLSIPWRLSASLIQPKRTVTTSTSFSQLLAVHLVLWSWISARKMVSFRSALWEHKNKSRCWEKMARSLSTINLSLVSRLISLHFVKGSKSWWLLTAMVAILLQT